MSRFPEDSESGASSRTCIATRAVRAPDEMIRFVRAPDGQVVPDLRRKLPGRGVWVTAERPAVEQAVRRKAFGRAFKAEVRVDAGMPDLVGGLLAEHALQALGMANKAGRLVAGFAKVESALRNGEAGALLHASDAAADGKRKLAQLAHGRPAVVELFSGEQLSLALGRPNVIHAALLSGPVSTAFLHRCTVLARYLGPHPADGTGGDMGQDGLKAAKAEGLDAE